MEEKISLLRIGRSERLLFALLVPRPKKFVRFKIGDRQQRDRSPPPLEEPSRVETQESPSLYFCHVCGTQVQADASFNCSQCGDGFIERIQTSPSPRPPSSSSEMGTARFLLGNAEVQLVTQRQPDETYGRGMEQMLTNIFETVLRATPADVRTSTFNDGTYGGFTTVLTFPTDPEMGGRLVDLRDYVNEERFEEILGQLLNQLEGAGPPPASPDAISRLEQYTVTENDVNEREADCAICMDKFTLAEVVCRLPCRHIFHKDCIDKWLKIHGTCPVCRKTLDGEDTSRHEFVVSVEGQPSPRTSHQTDTHSGTRGAGGSAEGGVDKPKTDFNDLD
ncbi:hypothetical protein ACOME3_005402 [Neoechinorhynchus agilis]